MNTKKIIVRFKEGKTPANRSMLATLDDSHLNFKRLYAIEPEINKDNGRRAVDARRYATPEELFEKEMLPKKSEEEKRLFRTYTVEFSSEEEAQAALEKLRMDQSVEYAQISNLNKLYYLPDDPMLKDLWGLAKINCPKAWDTSFGDNVVVAVIDTGVDYNHADLSGNMWRDASGNFGYDFSDNKKDPMDYHGHGTHVAGTIAALGNNALGVVGVAPKAKIMAIKIFPNATDDVCAQAIKHAVDAGARVLNNSWGPGERNPVNQTLQDAVDYALSKGVVVVFAAGNSGDEVKYYAPANHPGVITVAATDAKDNRCSFSNYGPEVTVAAPGEAILSAQLRGGYTSKRGTSMAAPHVSGLAALVLCKDPQLTASRIKQRIKEGTDKIVTDHPVGTGRINASNSLHTNGL